MRLVASLFVVCLLLVTPRAAMAQDVAGLPPLNPLPPALTAKTRYFTVVASFETERGAMRRLNELREYSTPVEAVVFPPAGRRGKYWTVVTASFTDFTSANARTREAAETRAALDAYVVGMKAVDWGDRHFVVHPPSVDLADAAGLVAQGPLPAVLQDGNHLVLLSSHPALADAERAAAILEDQFNRLKLSILKAPDGTFGVALATFVSAADAERALNIAARMGLQPLEPARLTPGVPPGWSVPAEIAERRAAVARKVTQCYAKELQTTVQQLRECSGEWLTPPLLSQCILESDCRGLSPESDIDAVLKRYGLARDGVLKMAVEGLPLSGNAEAVRKTLNTCAERAKGDQAALERCVWTSAVGTATADAMECLSAAKSSADSAACLAKGAHVDTTQIECLRAANGDTARALACVGAPEAIQQAQKFGACAATTLNDADALRRCLLPALPPEDAKRATCVIENRRDPKAILACVGTNAAPEVTTAAACLASTDGSGQAVARCIVRRTGGDAATLATCLDAASLRPSDVAACVAPNDPNAQRAVRLAACAANYASTSELLASCSEGIVDPKVATLAACAAAGDETQIGACAAAQFLPPETARLVACATGSQSATGVALCAAAPSLSEEWRIATECAMTSGGEPITFAGCTAGRLTVRELTKCLTGQDCFGPNNELVKAFNTVANDLTHGLGEQNEIVVATRPVVQGVEHLANEVGKVAQDVVQKVTQPLKDAPVIGPVVSGACQYLGC